jgi:nucleotide-binding universal stress UspA family protein
MSIKDILVHLDGSPRSDARLDLAVALAADHGAHLVGLHVIDPLPPAGLYGYAAASALYDQTNLLANIVQGSKDEAAQVEQKFRERLRRDGVLGEWRLLEGDPSTIVALHGRYSDLVVVGQHDRDTMLSGRDARLSFTVLMSSGRPLLVVPYAGTFAKIGRRVLVGWNATPEAARAVNEAIPLLRAAAKVTVLSINPKLGIGGDGDIPAADIALHLSRHGIMAQAAQTIVEDISEGDALLSYAADVDADLIVCGMYGHSRWHEAVFGGVTRSLLQQMTVPVFMSA